MASGWLHAMVPMFGLGANATVHVLMRRFAGAGMLRSLFVGFGAGLAVTAAGECCLDSLYPTTLAEMLGMAAANLLAAAALGYSYFHFVNLGETARRVRILRELREAGGELSERELLARYSARFIVQVRMERLLGNRQVVVRNGRYCIGRCAMLLSSRIIVAMKRLLLGRAGEATLFVDR